jgi:hypothetical protein
VDNSFQIIGLKAIKAVAGYFQILRAGGKKQPPLKAA